MTPELEAALRVYLLLVGLYLAGVVTVFAFLAWVFWRTFTHDHQDPPADRR